MSITMTDAELQAWVEQVSIRDFGLPFRHRARFNRRLKTTGGRYFIRSHDIDISCKQFEVHGPEEVERIIKHELCHYHLHLQGKGYRHRDAAFKQLLAQVGGTRFCRPTEASEKRKAAPYRYRLVCRDCGLEYRRRRKTDVNRYVCGRCSGKLLQFEL